MRAPVCLLLGCGCRSRRRSHCGGRQGGHAWHRGARRWWAKGWGGRHHGGHRGRHTRHCGARRRWLEGCGWRHPRSGTRLHPRSGTRLHEALLDEHADELPSLCRLIGQLSAQAHHLRQLDGAQLVGGGQHIGQHGERLAERLVESRGWRPRMTVGLRRGPGKVPSACR